MRRELTDAQWELIAPLLPARKRRGRPRAEDRATLNGILYVLRSGCRWQDIPRQYGAPNTCWRRLSHWQGDGTWERVWRTLLGTQDAQGKLLWAHAFLDGSFVPAKRGARQSA